MKVGIPAEVKNHEYRVAITPAGVRELVLNGHEVFIEAEPASARRSRTPSTTPPARGPSPPRTTCGPPVT